MSTILVAQRMWQRRDTAATWASVNPVLASGEIGVELGASSSDPQKLKVGNGATPWNDLSYISAGGVPVLMQNNGTYIQYSNDNGATWHNVASLASLTGPAGTPVEMRSAGTLIQWRYVGGSTWTTIFDMSTLQSPGRAPLVTGEIRSDQPTFLYNDEGNYIYAE